MCNYVFSNGYWKFIVTAVPEDGTDVPADLPGVSCAGNDVIMYKCFRGMVVPCAEVTHPHTLKAL